MKLKAILAVAAFGLAASGCLLQRELDAERHLQLYGVLPARDYQIDKRQRLDIPIGKGDRFDNGTVAPRGLGTEDRDLKSVLNPSEVDSALRGLASAFDEVELFTTPYTTFENASLNGVRIGDDPRAFIVSGVHARERGGPDNIVYFISDLLHAQKHGSGIKYGNKTYTNNDVATALSAGILIIPLVNPDGVAYDQETDECWRKNRNPASAKGNRDVGVDLNRNYDFLWDYKKAFKWGDMSWATASDDPSSEIFHGAAPLSEPETKSVAWVISSYPSLSWFLDLHSFGGDILYSWGDDNPQTTQPEQNFSNKTYDGLRGVIGDDPPDSKYREYMDKTDLDDERNAGERMAAAMAHAGNTPYHAIESAQLYPTSGVSTDFALSAYYSHHCGANKILGLSLEFGQSSTAAPCPFYPSKEEYHNSIREVATGLMEFLLTAAASGKPKVWQC
ncbi:hypothetical protein G7046_g1184 [Stylonectria norvegica]|nr:hypothetical protein G7046_g1184 [Stylonectria norvegica]